MKRKLSGQSADHIKSQSDYQYDAFMSYSRKDIVFATKLELLLERYRAPKGLGLKKRKLSIFRDVQDIVGNDLPDALTTAIKNSRHLLLVCSPDSKASPWVAKEIDAFVTYHGKEGIIPILIDGRPNHEVKPHDELHDQAFNEALYKYFQEPLAADFRSFEADRLQQRRKRHKEAKFQILALLLGEEKENLLKRQRTRFLRLLSVTLIFFILMTIAFAWIAYLADRNAKEAKTQSQIAEKKRMVALSRQLAAQAILEIQPGMRKRGLWKRGRNEERGALLARQAYLINKRVEGAAINQVDAALRQVLSVDFFSNVLEYERDWLAWVKSVAFSPDGSMLATGSGDGLVRIWHLDKPGEPPQVLSGQKGLVESVAFSPTGTMLASGGRDPEGRDNTVRLWNLNDLSKPLLSLSGHKAGVNAVAFSPDGLKLVSAGEDGAILIWELSNPTPVNSVSLTDNTVSARSLAFSPDGTLLAAGWSDGLVRIWAFDDLGDPLITLQDNYRGVNCVAFSPDGNFVASAGGGRMSEKDEVIHIWDLKTPHNPIRVLKGHGSSIRSIAFSPDGKILASGSDDTTIGMWDVVSGNQIGTPLTGHERWVGTVAFSPDGRYLASGNSGALESGRENTVRLWSMRSPPGIPQFFGGHKLIGSLALSHNGKILATGDYDGTIRLWHLSSGSPEGPVILTGHRTPVNTLLFDESENVLVSADMYRVLRWDLRESPTEAKELFQVNTLLPHSEIKELQQIQRVSMSPDGRYLAIAGTHDEGRTALLDLTRSDNVLLMLAGHSGRVSTLAFNPAGDILATGSYDHTIKLWNISHPNEEPVVIARHNDQINAVAFSPDGNFLASGGKDRVVLLHDMKNLNTEHVKLVGHERTISTLSFSPDGVFLASGSNDQKIMLWNIRRLGDPPVELNHIDSIKGIEFDNTMPILLSASGSGVWVWVISTETLNDWVCEMVRRNLSFDEWVRFVGSDVPYEKTCLNLPLGNGVK